LEFRAVKLLLFSDLHRDVQAAARLVELARSADVLVGAGDFASVRRGLNDCLNVLRAISCPAVLVPGNNESFEELMHTCKNWPSAHVLHGSGVTIGGVEFFGLGGGVPTTPFGDWSFDLTEGEAAEKLLDAPKGGVLVSHSPPKGAVDVASNGKSLGSVAVRDAIDRLQPQLVVCGHIHASAGQIAIIGATTIINAGPTGMTWTLSSQCGQ
jgi:uncharacterized protein